VLLVEGRDTIGGGMRSLPLTLPGFTHDVCSAIHPLALASPFFRSSTSPPTVWTGSTRPPPSPTRATASPPPSST
jgi:phytoene dehydrogenase-like protein